MTGFRRSSFRERLKGHMWQTQDVQQVNTHNEPLITILQDTSVHVRLSSSRSELFTGGDSTRSASSAVHNLSGFARASTQLLSAQRMLRIPSSFARAGPNPPSARQILRHVQLRKSWRNPHAGIPTATVRDPSNNSSSHNTTVPRYVQRPAHQTTIPRELT